MSPRTLAVMIAVSGCNQSPVAAPDAGAVLVGTGASATRTIGADGGVLALEGVTLDVPAGALDHDESITITSTRELPPVGFVSRSPLYRFEPAGLTFAIPVTVSIPFSGPPGNVRLFWGNAVPALGFVDTAATVGAGITTAQVSHFTPALNAEGCPPELPNNCDGTCVDFQNDPVNCGGCHFPLIGCGVKEVCYQGRCKQLCSTPATLYCGNGQCADPMNDPLNCGACGHNCIPSGTCYQGKCVSCATRGLMDCGGVCVNLQTSLSNCGACGNACGDPFNPGIACRNGQCGCDFGYTQCGPTTMPGACVRGACPTDGGVDSGACAPPMLVCNGACVDAMNDPANCGKCGNVCLRGPCVKGGCTIQCGTGQIYCSGSCFDAHTDKTNCGACGVACMGVNPACCGGRCTDLDSDPYNCGSCGTPSDCTHQLGPGAIVACCSGSCVDLRSGHRNGNDVDHCGACGSSCQTPALMSPECCNGACVDLAADRTNCGHCGGFCLPYQSCVPHAFAAGACAP